MAGYVAMARVSGGRVRTLAWEGAAEWAPADEPGVVDTGSSAVVEDDWVDELAERIARARETWSIMTFYLTDPNSWR